MWAVGSLESTPNATFMTFRHKHWHDRCCSAIRRHKKRVAEGGLEERTSESLTGKMRERLKITQGLNVNVGDNNVVFLSKCVWSVWVGLFWQ